MASGKDGMPRDGLRSFPSAQLHIRLRLHPEVSSHFRRWPGFRRQDATLAVSANPSIVLARFAYCADQVNA